MSDVYYAKHLFSLSLSHTFAEVSKKRREEKRREEERRVKSHFGTILDQCNSTTNNDCAMIGEQS